MGLDRYLGGLRYSYMRTSPEEVLQPIWALPFKGGGGSKRLPGWFGSLFWRRIVHVQMGICFIVGRGGMGSKCLSVWFWVTYAVKIEVQMGFCFIKGDVKACQDALGHLVITIKTVIWQSCSNQFKKEVPKSARLSTEGVGCNCYLGNAQIGCTTFSGVLPY